MARKTYILDTNILISDPDAIHAFEDNIVVIPTVVIEELDNQKDAPGDKGYNVRHAIRNLHDLQEDGSLKEGVPVGAGGTLIVYGPKLNLSADQNIFDAEKADNQILRLAQHITQRGFTDISNKEFKVASKVILVSNDLCMGVKADVLNVEVQMYKHEAADDDVLGYTGRALANVSDKTFEILCKNGRLTEEESEKFAKEAGLTIHKCEFFVVKNPMGGTRLAKEKNGIISLLEYETATPFGVTPRNVGQRFAIEALLAPASEIPLVIINGDAGTAKTFLTLACALEQTYSKRIYRKLTVTRANVEFDRTIGALPGEEDEKVGPLLRGCMDNLENLVDPAYVSGKTKDGSEAEVHDKVLELFERGIISAEALSFLRGRSLKRQILFVDEAQNTTISQAKGILTRPGEDCKIVIAGCLNQIDTPQVNKRNNGLAYALKLLGGKSPYCAVCTFTEAEVTRSKLAAEVASAINEYEKE